jgi:hypothetical protein
MNQSIDQAEFLVELFRKTSGAPQTTVSMFEVGAVLGLEKGAAGKLAEEVIAKGWAEIKTLSGGIGITAKGIAAAQAAGGLPAGATTTDEGLDQGPILGQPGRLLVEKLLTAIKNGLSGSQIDYVRLEELVIDIKTIEVQLLSPRPKTALLRAALASLQAGLDAAGARELSARVNRFIAR